MPDAPRKYHLINTAQLEAARKIWPKVSDRTWVLVLRRTDEPMVLNRAAHRGIGFTEIKIPEKTVDGMAYLRDIDILILVAGETLLAEGQLPR